MSKYYGKKREMYRELRDQIEISLVGTKTNIEAKAVDWYDTLYRLLQIRFLTVGEYDMLIEHIRVIRTGSHGPKWYFLYH